MNESRRDLVADTLAAHRDCLANDNGRSGLDDAFKAELACTCGQWSMPFGHLGITEVADEHRRHVASAILAALEGRAS